MIRNWSLGSAIALAAGVFFVSPALAAEKTLGTIERVDPAFDKLVPKDAVIEMLAEKKFEWSEGPVWLKADKAVLFSDIPRNMIWRWSEKDGLNEYLKPSGYTGKEAFTGREPGCNGLAIDKNGMLILCQHGDRRVVAMDLKKPGEFKTLADKYDGKRLNSPNDLRHPLQRRHLLHRSAVRLAEADGRSGQGTRIPGRLSTARRRAS